jgi:hypothetical protein
LKAQASSPPTLDVAHRYGLLISSVTHHRYTFHLIRGKGVDGDLNLVLKKRSAALLHILIGCI